jgi:hypothetical protein
LETPASTKAAEAIATAEIATVANDFGKLTFKCSVVLMTRSFALVATLLADDISLIALTTLGVSRGLPVYEVPVTRAAFLRW